MKTPATYRHNRYDRIFYKGEHVIVANPHTIKTRSDHLTLTATVSLGA